MVKGGGREAKMLPPLYVYDMEGNYTPELLEAYR
jgi:tRNA1(Val) A37 N6-methylase TrmN6